MLVLWLRDHGHGPLFAQGGLGLQRHRAAGRGLPGRSAGRAQPEGPAGLRHLRPRRAGLRRHLASRPTCRRSCCASRAPVWPWPTMRGKSYLALGSVSMGIAGSIVDHAFFEDYLGMRVESVDMVEFIRRWDEGIYDEESTRRAMAWVRENCQEGRDHNAPERPAHAAQKDEDWECVVKMAHDRARPDGRQPAPGRAGLRRGSAGPQRHRCPASRASASGPTSCPTAISWRRS